ncbi:unnamed protein product [Prunus armeniaca]
MSQTLLALLPLQILSQPSWQTRHLGFNKDETCGTSIDKQCRGYGTIMNPEALRAAAAAGLGKVS